MRKERKYNYIYKTTCTVTNRYYIGMHSTNKLDDGYLGSGKRLWFSINYHGKDNHTKEILEYFDTREELKKREEEIVNERLLREDLCMNLMTGGQGGFSSEEHMIKAITAGGASHANKMKMDEVYRTKILKTLDEGRKKAYLEGKLKVTRGVGRIHSEKTKKKMGESSKGMGKGKTNSQFGTCWVTNGKEVKKIKKEDLDSYISDGWKRGRKI